MAALKRSLVVALRRPNIMYFHGYQAVAALKLRGAADHRRARVYFHGYQAVAALKPEIVPPHERADLAWFSTAMRLWPH